METGQTFAALYTGSAKSGSKSSFSNRRKGSHHDLVSLAFDAFNDKRNAMSFAANAT